MNDTRIEILLEKYRFYTQEARHQRMMMWETAKWFSAIVIGLFAFSGQLLIRFENIQNKSFQNAVYPTIILILILLISIICVLLIRSFYRTNLIYLSMLIKIEDEFGFDERKIKDNYSFSEDRIITWSQYKKIRRKYTTSESFVFKQLKIWGRGIYARLSWVFIMFGIFSLTVIFYIFAQL